MTHKHNIILIGDRHRRQHDGSGQSNTHRSGKASEMICATWMLASNINSSTRKLEAVRCSNCTEVAWSTLTAWGFTKLSVNSQWSTVNGQKQHVPTRCLAAHHCPAAHAA